MWLNDSQPTLVDCEVMNNRAEHPVWDSGGAGAIWVGSGRLTLIDSVVSGNSAKDHSGAIFSTHEDALVLVSSRLCDNQSPDVQVSAQIEVTNLGGCIADDCDACVITDPADFNRDGVVAGEDLALLLANWMTTNPQVDLTLDGVVDGADLTRLLAAWD